MSESEPSNTVTAGDEAYWQKAVERMTDLTKAGKLKWDVVETANAKVSSPLTVFAAYDTRYDNKIVRFLETEPAPNSAMTAFDRASAMGPTLSSMLGASARARRTEHSLLLIDLNGVPLFAFPKSVELIELLAAIKYQIADPESFVNALFAAA